MLTFASLYTQHRRNVLPPLLLLLQLPPTFTVDALEFLRLTYPFLLLPPFSVAARTGPPLWWWCSSPFHHNAISFKSPTFQLPLLRLTNPTTLLDHLHILEPLVQQLCHIPAHWGSKFFCSTNEISCTSITSFNRTQYAYSSPSAFLFRLLIFVDSQSLIDSRPFP